MKYFTFWFFIFFLIGGLNSQTVGVIQHSSELADGYVLMAPNSTDYVYLIDNCGRVVHEWFTDVRPGLRTILQEDGLLIRTKRVNGAFFGGGVGGGIEAFDWDGNTVWNFIYANTEVHLHHDIDILPNGNIIAIAWEKISNQEAIALGRLPNSINQNGMWPDHVIEYNPGLDSIVWSWHVKDHLIQDVDANLENFGIISDHPELFDINLNSVVNGDWNHFNSINYNEKLDQILLSSRTMNEIYIIDHSTSTLEAAGHSGGRWGKGGDILYRWGNPQNYGRGNALDQVLYGQHDARWLDEPAPDAGKIMLFNNGAQRPGGSYSTIELVETPVNSEGVYTIDDNNGYGPTVPQTLISGASTENNFYSDRISGANQLENGNVLVCVGLNGRLLEFNVEGSLVWEYINPLNGTLPVSQGSFPMQNQIFKVARYAPDYQGFEGQDLLPGEPLELNPDIQDCLLTDTQELIVEDKLSVYPNPASAFIKVEATKDSQISLMDLSGRLRGEYFLSQGLNQIDVSQLEPGVYILNTLNFKRKLVIAK